MLRNIEVTDTRIMQKSLGEHNRRDLRVTEESGKILGVLNKVVCMGMNYYM